MVAPYYSYIDDEENISTTATTPGSRNLTSYAFAGKKLQPADSFVTPVKSKASTRLPSSGSSIYTSHLPSSEKTTVRAIYITKGAAS